MANIILLLFPYLEAKFGMRGKRVKISILFFFFSSIHMFDNLNINENKINNDFSRNEISFISEIKLIFIKRFLE